MGERLPLLHIHPATEYTSASNGDLNVTASMASGCETSLQVTDVDELQSLLDKAQTLLREYTEETTVRKSFLPHWLIRYLLPLSIIWQLVCIGVLSIVDFKTISTSSHHTAKIVSNVTLTVFTAIHLIVVILITMRVAAKVAAHTATFTFLIQSYLSTVLLFSGLYTLCTRFQCHAFRHINERNGSNYCSSTDEIILIDLFVRLLFFSVSNSTLCGITDIQPNKWYTELTVALQMLLSFLYFASILTHTYHKNIPPRPSIWERNAVLRALKKWIAKVSA